ncbi:hypothetical protein BKP45_21020 [Anaerobacillus alkalidiazotrophicus]|uniref:Uncharacterized protein n=1 Tax=Anaerobacillus alkalidiazotrophicus TaxID=472963 RepID=A0A1S2LYF6_9BACI|nr:hypothetical protein [Anaerobacillus alkalidiazotrophicus]OIJ16445.1 hypothetical protein BKP45_21315 [Anaerobacillus alkalidiazotrophicus]OIJ16491.1 hypothetical protein BKP45_21020 [Anaerobacillus alkalidiazotrophicus]
MLEKIQLNTKMEYILQEVNLELLPTEIRKHNLVSWIIGFTSHSKDKPSIYDYSDDYNTFFSSEVNRLIQSSIVSNTTYYLASLFHLGRQWKTSLSAIDLIEQALQETNLKKTVYENRSHIVEVIEKLELSSLLENLDADLEKVMESILKKALDDHRQKILTAKLYWQIWKKEVQDYQELVNYSDFKQLHYSISRYENYEHSLKEDFINELINLVTTDFLNKELYSTLNKETGMRLKKSIDRSALQDLYLFTSILNDLFESEEERTHYYNLFLNRYIHRLHVDIVSIKKKSNRRNAKKTIDW